jgi:hypothetical protein
VYKANIKPYRRQHQKVETGKMEAKKFEYSVHQGFVDLYETDINETYRIHVGTYRTAREAWAAMMEILTYGEPTTPKAA